MSSVAMGGELGLMNEKPWIGIFAGLEDRNLDFAIGGDGESELFFKKGRDRTGIHQATSVRYIVEEQIKNRWVRRSMVDDGFETKNKPGLDQEKVSFTATYTGGTKMEIIHAFGKSEVAIGVQIVEFTTKNPIRACVQVVVPDMYRSVEAGDAGGRELKKKLKDFRVKAVSLEGKSVKLRKLEDDVDLDEHPILSKGAEDVSVEASFMRGKELIIASKEVKFGRLEFEQSKKIYHGFNVLWRPVPEKVGEEDCRLVIEVK